MATDIIMAARGWIGTPYRHQASLKGVGCDCLGLLRGVWRELHGAEPEQPPPYAPDWGDTGTRETMRDAFARHLASVMLDAVAPGDFLLFRMGARGPAKHCAILAGAPDRLTLIHTRQNKRVSEEPFTKAWRARLAYGFRV